MFTSPVGSRDLKQNKKNILCSILKYDISYDIFHITQNVLLIL